MFEVFWICIATCLTEAMGGSSLHFCSCFSNFSYICSSDTTGLHFVFFRTPRIVVVGIAIPLFFLAQQSYYIPYEMKLSNSVKGEPWSLWKTKFHLPHARRWKLNQVLSKTMHEAEYFCLDVSSANAILLCMDYLYRDCVENINK